MGPAMVEFSNPDQVEAAEAAVAPRLESAEGATRRVLGGEVQARTESIGNNAEDDALAAGGWDTERVAPARRPENTCGYGMIVGGDTTNAALAA